jgi:site-specific DNA-cytosine methylase
VSEQPIGMLDLFSGIGGFALAADIANAMADAKQQQDHGERRDCDEAWMFQASQRNHRTTHPNSTYGCRRLVSIAHSEIDPYACAVYHRHFPDSVCLGPVQNVTRDTVIERCGVLPDVVCGGFPCQPHSCAGKRLASADDRDLWDECRSVLRELRPRFALFENVGGLLTSESGLFFNRVLSDLAALRYACQWQVIPASAVGAPHRRDRVWMLCWDELADADETRRRELCMAQPSGPQQPTTQHCGHLSWPALSGQWPSRPGERQHGWEPPRVVGNTEKLQRTGSNNNRIGGIKGTGEISEPRNPTCNIRRSESWRQAQSTLGCNTDGIPTAVVRDGQAVGQESEQEVFNRVNQLKCLGNAIVPEVAAIFLLAIRRMIDANA